MAGQTGRGAPATLALRRRAGCNRPQVLLGATILIVHHLDKRGKGPRGSNALMGAAEMAYTPEPGGGGLWA